jgi:hypothetical protein
MWAGVTAVVVYDLLSSPEVWLVGYRRGASPSTWSTLVPNLGHSIDAPTPRGVVLSVSGGGEKNGWTGWNERGASTVLVGLH